MADLHPTELLRVDDQRWGFTGVRTGAALIPFGGSLVDRTPAGLDTFGPQHDPSRLRVILDRCAAQGMNTLRVCLPVAVLMPHPPRRDGSLTLDEPRIERLERCLRLCQEHGIRVVVAFSLWRAATLDWWRQGATVFGKMMLRSDDAPCAFTTHTRMVYEIARRFRNHPQIFAWSVAAEWMLPDPQWTAPVSSAHPGWSVASARWYWLRFALARYDEQLERLNRAWGVSVRNPGDIAIPEISWDPAAHRYTASPAMLADYQLFREWASLRFLRPQIAAIRRASPGHLVTCGMPMRQWDLAAGEAARFPGLSTPSISPWLDYVTVHFHGDAPAGSSAPRSERHQLEMACRFAWSGERRPVVIEELDCQGPTDDARAQALGELIRTTVGHASGWMTTHIQRSTPQPVGETTDQGIWVDEAMRPTPWGRSALAIRTELERANRTRKPPRRTVTLDRLRELVPVKPSTVLTEMEMYSRRPQPVDYRVDTDPALQVTLTGDEIIQREAIP